MGSSTNSRVPKISPEVEKSRLRWGVISILVLAVLAAAYAFPSQSNRLIESVNSKTGLGLPLFVARPISLGLDLRGGAELVYEADVSILPEIDRIEALEGARDVIEKRVNSLGVGESNVLTTRVGDSYRINVELPGVTDTKEAIAKIGETPTLDFRQESVAPPQALSAEELASLESFNNNTRAVAEENLNKIKAGTSLSDIAKSLTVASGQSSSGEEFDGYLGFVPEGQLPPQFLDAIRDLPNGTLVPELVLTDYGYHIVEKRGERDGGDVIEASHILICFAGAESCENPIYSDPEAKALAEDILKRATKENFASLANQYSNDKNTPNGSLGQVRKGVMVPEFENALFASQVGEIIGPVKTPFGYHVIYNQSRRQEKEYEISQLFFQIRTEQDLLSANNWEQTKLSGSQLQRAEVVTDPQTGVIQVALRFNAEGRELFRQITEKNINKPVAIFLDGQIVSAPIVQQIIYDGEAVIQGQFNLTEARELARQLNAGALPVPISLEAEQQIGSTLGLDSLHKSLSAGLVALLLVIVYMLVVYRFPGFLASISLLVYSFLTLAAFKFFGVTMTLAGIAGLIISVGMAVDANILIFERLKEELRAGKTIKAAIDEAFVRAWTAIRDGNVSTLLTCAILWWFGSSFVRGFAMILSIGILVSFFSSITITRTFLRLFLPMVAKRFPNLALLKKADMANEAISK